MSNNLTEQPLYFKTITANNFAIENKNTIEAFTQTPNYIDYKKQYSETELKNICSKENQDTMKNTNCDDIIKSCISPNSDCNNDTLKKCYETQLCKNIELKKQMKNKTQIDNGKTQLQKDLEGTLRQNIYKTIFYGFSIFLLSYDIIYNVGK